MITNGLTFDKTKSFFGKMRKDLDSEANIYNVIGVRINKSL